MTLTAVKMNSPTKDVLKSDASYIMRSLENSMCDLMSSKEGTDDYELAKFDIIRNCKRMEHCINKNYIELWRLERSETLRLKTILNSTNQQMETMAREAKKHLAELTVDELNTAFIHPNPENDMMYTNTSMNAPLPESRPSTPISDISAIVSTRPKGMSIDFARYD